MLHASKKRVASLLIFILTFGILSMSPGMGSTAYAAGGVSLYTTYTSLTAPPGEEISYSIDVINNTDEIQNVGLSVDTGASKWSYELSSGGHQIQQIAVKPHESQTLNLQLNVPLEVSKGDYTFSVKASTGYTLQLKVKVSEQGTYKTELTSEQPNIQGHAETTFNFSATLRNRTAEKQLYSLRANAPAGWDVKFSVAGSDVASVNVEPNATEEISITAVPPKQVQADTYKIPIQAVTNSTSAETELEAVITGTYGIKLSTPNDLLSTSVTSGSSKNLDLVVTNTGTSTLKDIQMSSAAPVDWEVTFEPKTIASLDPGQTASVQATIKADKKAIAGDYVVNMTAQSVEKSADAQFRVAVKTSMLWGWLGVLIILAVAGGVYYLFRTYGRR
ncbi:COG1470 family protein [Paenibacillus marinisediminis]